MTDLFQYDIAISFLQRDEPLAIRFAAALEPLATFVYSKRQEQLAGTDGMDSFRAAFKDQSRLNVILLRAAWGTTRFTRVEENAIKDRCFDEGFNSLLVVQLEPSLKIKWCSDHKIYFDILTFPFDQAVGAIKRQASALGSELKPLTALQRAQKQAASADYDLETRALFGSDAGVREADASVSLLFADFERDVMGLGNTIPRWTPIFGQKDGHAVARLGQASAVINWRRSRFNLHEAKLVVTIFDRPFATPQETVERKLYIHVGTPRKLDEFSYVADRQPGSGLCWRDPGGKFLSAADIAGVALEALSKAATRVETQGFIP